MHLISFLSDRSEKKKDLCGRREQKLHSHCPVMKRDIAKHCLSCSDVVNVTSAHGVQSVQGIACTNVALEMPLISVAPDMAKAFVQMARQVSATSSSGWAPVFMKCLKVNGRTSLQLTRARKGPRLGLGT